MITKQKYGEYLIRTPINYTCTNLAKHLDETVIAQVTQEANDFRWQIEEFHRELKQWIGSDKGQCRKDRFQRNYLACCYNAWLSVKVHTKRLNKSIYRVRTDQFRDYLCARLHNPNIPAFQFA
jgi:hypothetical protein